MSLAFLLDPSGHGPFILASFGVTFVVLLANIVLPILRGRQLRREIRDEIRAGRSSS